MSDSNTRIVKVVLISLIFCAVSIGILIGLSTLASNYIATYQKAETSNSENKSEGVQNVKNIQTENSNTVNQTNPAPSEPKPAPVPQNIQPKTNPKDVPLKSNPKSPTPNSSTNNIR